MGPRGGRTDRWRGSTGRRHARPTLRTTGFDNRLWWPREVHALEGVELFGAWFGAAVPGFGHVGRHGTRTPRARGIGSRVVCEQAVGAGRPGNCHEGLFSRLER